MRFFLFVPLLFLFFLAPLVAFATDDIVLTWDTPTLYEDGAALPVEDIDGYVIKHAGNYIFIGSALTLTYRVVDAGPGVHAFKIATMAGGLVGNFSDYIFQSIDGTVKMASAPEGFGGS